MKTSIIIPTYNHCDDLLKPCVESVITYSHMTDVELVISANGCTDGTRSYVEHLQDRFTQLGFPDHVKLVWHDEALGFSRAVNAGIRASTGDRVLLLNNDVVLLPQSRNQWLDRLHAPFDANPRVGITSTLKLYSPQTGRHFAVFFCTLIDRKVIDQIGLLDEAFGVGAGEDTEYCFRAECAGYEVVGVAKSEYSPEAGTNVSDFPIWHKAEGTMHDPELVPNWHNLFAANTQLLEQRFAPTCVAHSTQHLAEKFPQLCVADAETPNLFREVLVDNSYNLTCDHVRNREIIDVGANVGFFSLAAAAMGAYKVFSYEPASNSYRTLMHNIRQLALTDKIVCYPQAVMGVNHAPMSLGIHDRHGSNSVYKPGTQFELVNVTTLEHIMSLTYSHDVILKLDCEGAEFDILLQTPDHVFDRIRHIHLEIHTQIHPIHKSRNVMATRLEQLGFTCVRSANMGMWWYNTQGEPVRFDPGHFFNEYWCKK
jgi:FkbM family methyltransferase